jgi:hypothetical protein
MQGVLGHRYAAHLLRRTSYRYTKAKVDEMAGQTAAEALASLLQLYPLQLEQPIYGDNSVTWILPPGSGSVAVDTELRPWLASWWANEALHDAGIGHRMTFFLHQYNAVAMPAAFTTHYFDYLSLLRWGALGNFKMFITKMVTDNCMLKYLDNTENSEANPNENFAREFFELFTIGKGPQAGPGDYTNFTEDDIVAASKVFTGFRFRGQRDEMDADTNIPKGRVNFNFHDDTAKTFSDRFQGTTIAGATNADEMWTELNALVDMTFAQPETAKNFCRRIYRFFVSRHITPEIETDIITGLADTMVANNFEIKPVLEQLLQSQHFFDLDDSDNADEIIGGLIKSPLELSLQAISFYQIPLPDPLTQPQEFFNFYTRGVLTRMFQYANLPIFFPDDVAGYPGLYQQPDYHRGWFNSSTIVARYKLPEMLLTGTLAFGGAVSEPLGIQLNIADWIKNSGNISDATDPYVLVQDLLEYFLPEATDNDRFNYFYNTVFLDQLPPADWTYEWQAYLNTGDDTEVKIPLARLINAIMYSAEYQLF